MDKLIRAFFLGFVSLATSADLAFAAVCSVNNGLIQPADPDIQLNGVAGVPGLVIGVGEPTCDFAPKPPCNDNLGVVYVNGAATTLPANTAQLNGVSVASTNYAVAVGDKKFGTTPLVQFDGTTWTAMPTAGTEPSQDANGVKTYGPNQTYVVGDQGIYFFDGTTWTRQFNTGNVPNVNGRKASKFEAIWGDATNVYALADNGALYTKAAAAPLTTWTRITAAYPAGANQANFQAITGDAAGNVYVTGQTDNNKGFVYQYNPTIGAWTNLITTAGTFDLNGIAINPVNGAITAVGDNGGQITSGPNGADPWTQIPEANNTNDINAVYIDPNGTTYLAGQTAAGCTAPTGPDHIEIDHDGGGLTCSAETVTIKACADNLNPCTLYTAGGLSVTLTPGGQAFAIDATGINSAASVQQSTATAPGVPVTLSAVSDPAATDATPTTCWNTATSTASCDMTFSDSGFVVTAPDHVSCNNASVTIEAVQTAPGTGRCVPAYQSVTRAVNLYTAYASPVTGTMAATASADGGTSWFAVNTASPGTAQNLAFDATGKATILLNYQDAGQLALNATGTAPTGTAMAGSGSFVVAPASFVFSGIPAAPLTAGQAFNATVTAMNACATPAVTPNFTGQTVTITPGNPQPGLGNEALIATPLIATSGTGSANLTWNEVGTIDLNASRPAYLGSALSISGVQAGVGSFRPAYFDTAVVPTATTPMPCPNGVACPAAFNGFVYSSQPFSVQVMARSLAGSTTANYVGAFAKATTLAAWDALGSTATQNPGPGVLANNAVAAADFAAGIATLATPTYTFAAATAPTSIFMRATDTDGVTSLRAVPATSVEGGVTVASGRIRLSNAHGSELLPLPLTANVQFWNGTFWVVSATDSVTSLTLAATYNVLDKSGATTGTTTPTPTGTATVANGILNINLSKPTGGAGSATVTPVGPAYLPLTGGLATFGVYRGNNEFIYLRENY